MELAQIVAGLKKPGKSKQGLAKALGRQPSAVTALLKGERQLKATEIPKVEKYLELNQPDMVRLVGYVSAGEAHFVPAGDLGEVEGLADCGTETVAVEVRGNSLGQTWDGSLVFYDDVRRPVTPDLHNKLCVVGLEDGRILVKRIQPSRAKGRYHLISETEAPIMDARIEWAAKVKHVVPR